MEALKKKESQGEIQFTIKTEVPIFECGFCFESHPIYDKLKVLVLFFLLYR
jgi:hypothetical protein